MAVADGLAHGHDVGSHALSFEHPEMRTSAAEAGLDLVGDADAAGRAHPSVDVAEVAGGQDDLAGAAQRGLAEKSGEIRAATVGERYTAPAIFVYRSLTVAALSRDRQNRDVIRLAAAAGAVELVG